MLVSLSTVVDLLYSPDDKADLSFEFDSTGNLVRCYSAKREFQVAKGAPVLLPESSSFLESESVDSPVARKRSRFLRTLSVLINGGNPVARQNARRFIERLKSSGRRKVLVIGAGLIGEGSESLYAAPEIDVVAFDVYRTADVNFVADAHLIPIKDHSFDAVWIQAVLEHVVDPHQVVSEIHRVLKPSGLVYVETPFMQQVHEGRFDFQRFTESGHRWLFRRFSVIDTGVVWGPGRTLQWAIRYFFWGITRSKNAAILLSIPFSFVRIFDRLVPRSHASDGASNLYFFGEKCEQGVAVSELLSFYKGAQ